MGRRSWLRILSFVGWGHPVPPQHRLQTGNGKKQAPCDAWAQQCLCPLPTLLDPVLRVTPLQSAQSDFCHPISQSHPTLQLPGIHSHTFNPLSAFNAFSRAVSTTVARGQEGKSPSGMVGTRPVQSPPQHCFHNGFFCPGIQF